MGCGASDDKRKGDTYAPADTHGGGGGGHAHKETHDGPTDAEADSLALPRGGAHGGLGHAHGARRHSAHPNQHLKPGGEGQGQGQGQGASATNTNPNSAEDAPGADGSGGAEGGGGNGGDYGGSLPSSPMMHQSIGGVVTPLPLRGGGHLPQLQIPGHGGSDHSSPQPLAPAHVTEWSRPPPPTAPMAWAIAAAEHSPAQPAEQGEEGAPAVAAESAEGAEAAVAVPVAQSADDRKAILAKTLRSSLFGTCLAPSDLSTLIAMSTLHNAAEPGTRIYSQNDRAHSVFLVASGSVRLELWAENVSGPYSAGATCPPPPPLGQDGLPLDGVPLPSASEEQEEEESDADNLGHEFLLGGNNLGTFLSPKHGLLTRAETQAAEAATQAALAQKLEKAARDAHLARKAAAAAAKEKERSDRLKQGSDAQFRAQAAALITGMTSPSNTSQVRPNAAREKEQKEKAAAEKAAAAAAAAALGGTTPVISSPMSGAMLVPDSPASRMTAASGGAGGGGGAHSRNSSSSFILPPRALPGIDDLPAAALTLQTSNSKDSDTARVGGQSKPHHEKTDSVVLTLPGKQRQKPSMGGGQDFTENAPSSNQLRSPSHASTLSNGGDRGHRRRTSDAGSDFGSNGGMGGMGGSTSPLLHSPGPNGNYPQTPHTNASGSPPAPEQEAIEIPDGVGTVRVCVKQPGQLFGHDAFLGGAAAATGSHASSAVVHAPGTSLVVIPWSALDGLMLSGPAVRMKLRAHLGEALYAAITAAAWLKLLDARQRSFLASMWNHAVVPAGTVLFSNGDCTLDSSPIFFLVDGAVDLALVDERGRQIRKKIESGKFVGELATVVGLCRTGTVTTAKPCVVRMLQRRWLTLFFRTQVHVPLAQTACKVLLSAYQVRDEQLLEQMDVQSAFGLFCLKEYSAENIEFWQTAVRFRKVIAPAIMMSQRADGSGGGGAQDAHPDDSGVFSKQDVLTEAALLYTRYISERSLVQINLKEGVRSSVLSALRSGVLRADTFLRAEAEILHLMLHDNWNRFKASKGYSLAIGDVEPPEPRPILPLPKNASAATQTAAVAADTPWLTSIANMAAAAAAAGTVTATAGTAATPAVATAGAAAAAATPATDALCLRVEFRWGPPVGKQMGEMLFNAEGEVRTADNDPPAPEPVVVAPPQLTSNAPANASRVLRQPSLPVVFDSPMGPAPENGMSIIMNTPMGTAATLAQRTSGAADGSAGAATDWQLQNSDEALLGGSRPTTPSHDEAGGGVGRTLTLNSGSGSSGDSQLRVPMSPSKGGGGGGSGGGFGSPSSKGGSGGAASVALNEDGSPALARPSTHSLHRRDSSNAGGPSHHRRQSSGGQALRRPTLTANASMVAPVGSGNLRHASGGALPPSVTEALSRAASGGATKPDRRASTVLAPVADSSVASSGSNSPSGSNPPAASSLIPNMRHSGGGHGHGHHAAHAHHAHAAHHKDLNSAIAEAVFAATIANAAAQPVPYAPVPAHRAGGARPSIAVMGTMGRKGHSVHTKLKASPFNQQLAVKKPTAVPR